MVEESGTKALVGRPLSGFLGLLAGGLGLMGLGVGAVLVAASVFGWTFGAWEAAATVTTGLVGALLLGVAPGLFVVMDADLWEESRILIWPMIFVVVAQTAVNVLERGSLTVVTGGAILAFLFSLGWFVVFAGLAVAALLGVVRQYGRPRGAAPASRAPLPGWSRPPVAILGSAWLGLGAGLLVLPGYWGAFVPWETSRIDARTLGVVCAALGIALLTALAENDLDRVRSGLPAAAAIPVAAGIVLACHPSDVHWSSGPALALIALLAGTFATGVSGYALTR
ncbi:hypothetical protein GCM10027589_17590 [Actinocorallia lasiicapitis]